MSTYVYKVQIPAARNAARRDSSFFGATPEERCRFRLLVAEYLMQRGLISKGERRELHEEAMAAYADELG